MSQQRQDWNVLFRDHAKTLQNRAERVCETLFIPGLLIDAGAANYYFEDDASVPFRPAHHFAAWCPAEGEQHLLLIRPGKKPLLHLFIPKDYWHEPPQFGSPFWADSFEVVIHDDPNVAWREVSAAGSFAYIGPRPTKAEAMGHRVNVDTLLPRLNWDRSYKTPYEVQCLSVANETAAVGHKAALESFKKGGTELEIQYAYLAAMQAREADMPYYPIIALNEKAACLHYHNRRKTPGNGNVFLIDAGYSVNGYGSDITRTYATDKAPKTFKDLIKAVEGLERTMADASKPGVSFGELQWQTHIKIGQILLDTGVMKGVTAEAAAENNLVRHFYPHGLGHMLGIFVHDVAGKQRDAVGSPMPPHRSPYLRNLRQLEAGFVVTVEPGIYFIDLLLEELKARREANLFDWKLIDTLRPCGGIRIEDDIFITATGHQNLTRPYLPFEYS